MKEESNNIKSYTYRQLMEMTRRYELQPEDDLLAEAMEGYRKVKTSSSDIKEVELRVRRRIDFQSGLPLIRAFVFVAVLGCVVAVLYYIGHERKVVQPEKIITSTSSNDFIQIKSDDVYAEIKTEFAEEKKTLTHSPIRPIALPAKSALEKVSAIQISYTELEDDQQPYLERYFNVPVKKYNDVLLLVDYGALKAPHDSATNIGYSCDDEIITNPIGLEPAERIVSLHYNAIVEKMLNAYNLKDFKQVGEIAQMLLVARPDDQNALFYWGMSAYNVNEQKIAALNFTKILNTSINVFEEPAMFYLAKVYLLQGYTDESIELLEAVISYKGKYTKQAADILKHLPQ